MNEAEDVSGIQHKASQAVDRVVEAAGRDPPAYLHWKIPGQGWLRPQEGWRRRRWGQLAKGLAAWIEADVAGSSVAL